MIEKMPEENSTEPSSQEEGRQCPNCGQIEPLDANFCAGCGYKLQFTGEVSAEAQPEKSHDKKAGGFSRWALIGALFAGAAAKEGADQLIGRPDRSPETPQRVEPSTQTMTPEQVKSAERSANIKQALTTYIEAFQQGKADAWWAEHQATVDVETSITILMNAYGVPRENFEILESKIAFMDSFDRFYEVDTIDLENAITSAIKKKQQEINIQMQNTLNEFKKSKGKDMTINDVPTFCPEFINLFAYTEGKTTHVLLDADEIVDSLGDSLDSLERKEDIPERLLKLSKSRII